MFKITQGKGIHITFENGYGVSIQFGWGNYCSHRDNEPSREVHYTDHQAKLGAEGSVSAEVAIIHESGGFISDELNVLSGDAVEGWCSPKRVLEIMNQVAALPRSDDKGGYQSDNPLFKSLDADEADQYRQWARDNYVCGSDVNEIWHPVVQKECHLMNEEEAA